MMKYLDGVGDGAGAGALLDDPAEELAICQIFAMEVYDRLVGNQKEIMLLIVVRVAAWGAFPYFQGQF